MAQEILRVQSGGAPALRPGAIAPSPGREAALAWASLAQRFTASSVLGREGAGCVLQGQGSQGCRQTVFPPGPVFPEEAAGREAGLVLNHLPRCSGHLSVLAH